MLYIVPDQYAIQITIGVYVCHCMTPTQWMKSSAGLWCNLSSMLGPNWSTGRNRYSEMVVWARSSEILMNSNSDQKCKNAVIVGLYEVAVRPVFSIYFVDMVSLINEWPLNLLRVLFIQCKRVWTNILNQYFWSVLFGMSTNFPLPEEAKYES